MAFPNTPVLDAFTRADGALGANWTAITTAGEAALTIVGNQVKGVTASTVTNGMLWNGNVAVDLEAYMDVITLPTAGDWVALWCRGDAAGNNTYILRVTASTTLWDIRKRVGGGASTSVGSNASTALAAGDSIGISCLGSVLTAWRKTAGSWSQVVSVTDSSVTAAGMAGIELLGNTATVDNFGGGIIYTVRNRLIMSSEASRRSTRW